MRDLQVLPRAARATELFRLAEYYGLIHEGHVVKPDQVGRKAIGEFAEAYLGIVRARSEATIKHCTSTPAVWRPLLISPAVAGHWYGRDKHASWVVIGAELPPANLLARLSWLADEVLVGDPLSFWTFMGVMLPSATSYQDSIKAKASVLRALEALLALRPAIERGTLTLVAGDILDENRVLGDLTREDIQDAAAQIVTLASAQYVNGAAMVMQPAHTTANYGGGWIWHTPVAPSNWSRAPQAVREAQTTLSLQLPTIEGARLEDLLDLREREWDAFRDFRTAIRRYVAAHRDANLRFEALVAQVQAQVADELRPAAARLQRELASSTWRAAIKGLAAGAVATWALHGVSLELGLLAGATTSFATAAGDLMQDLARIRADASKNAAYFLAEAERLVHSNEKPTHE